MTLNLDELEALANDRSPGVWVLCDVHFELMKAVPVLIAALRDAQALAKFYSSDSINEDCRAALAEEADVGQKARAFLAEYFPEDK